LETSTGLIATLSRALFAGAVVYINVVKHPARVSCGTEVAATEWAPSCQRAPWMQAPLAILGFPSAVIAWLAGSSISWLIGGAFLSLMVPFTLVVIKPTHKRLLSSDLDKGPEKARTLPEKWNMLHGVRTAPCVLPFILFLTDR
jgi:Domain of unknown function (DUF1772)